MHFVYQYNFQLSHIIRFWISDKQHRALVTRASTKMTCGTALPMGACAPFPLQNPLPCLTVSPDITVFCMVRGQLHVFLRKQTTVFSRSTSMARGVGFEPTRPFPATDLAGLPPTRLGQPRPVFQQPRRFLRGFLGAFAWFSFASSRTVVSLVYLRFRKNSRSSFSQMYSNPTEISFLISSLSFVAITSYSSSLLNPNMARSTCM